MCFYFELINWIIYITKFIWPAEIEILHIKIVFFFLNDCNKKSWLDWEKARILNFKNSKHHNINLIPLENNGRFKKTLLSEIIMSEID